MSLYSKSNFFQTLFFMFGCAFTILWVLMFVSFIMSGDHFCWESLLLLPVLIIPTWMFYVFQVNLERLKLTDTGITVYKLCILKYKHYSWTDFDYSFHTISRGRGGNFRVMYLVNDQKLIIRIADNNYRNYFDISEFVSSRTDSKGLIQLNSFNELNFLFRRKVKRLP